MHHVDLVTIALCWHLFECSNDIPVITNVNLKLCPGHQDALALQSGPRFLPTVTQLQQSSQCCTVTSLACGCSNVQSLHSLQRPQRHRGERSCFLHCNKEKWQEMHQQDQAEYSVMWIYFFYVHTQLSVVLQSEVPHFCSRV